MQPLAQSGFTQQHAVAEWPASVKSKARLSFVVALDDMLRDVGKVYAVRAGGGADSRCGWLASIRRMREWSEKVDSDPALIT